jgi:hypothetical protein
MAAAAFVWLRTYPTDQSFGCLRCPRTSAGEIHSLAQAALAACEVDPRHQDRIQMSRKLLERVARPAGFEPPTFGGSEESALQHHLPEVGRRHLASHCGNRSTDQRGAEPVTIRTSAGMLNPDAVKYRLEEARTSSLNCALCSGGILRSLSRRLSDISVRSSKY